MKILHQTETNKATFNKQWFLTPRTMTVYNQRMMPPTEYSPVFCFSTFNLLANSPGKVLSENRVALVIVCNSNEKLMIDIVSS